MHWGNKILIAILVFIGLMGYLVYRSVHTQYELVSDTYYKEELAFQQIIDGTNRANQLSTLPIILHQNNHIDIRLPEEMKGSKVKGTLHFYCPVNAGKDRIFSLQTDSSGTQTLDDRNLSPGKYIVKMRWEKDELTYYTEQKIEIAP